jgi:hypothetical protein
MAARAPGRLFVVLLAAALPAVPAARGQAVPPAPPAPQPGIVTLGPPVGVEDSSAAPVPAVLPPAAAPQPAPPPELPPPTPLAPASPVGPAPTPFLPPAPAGVPVTPPPDAGIFAPPSPSLAFFFGTEVQILKPNIVNHVQGPATFPGGPTVNVAVPEASLPWAVSPRFEIGKFLPDNLGFLALSYRFLATSGTAMATAPNGKLGELGSQLDFNVVDFDYGLPGHPIAPHWDGLARFGIRLGQAYFDSQLTDAALSTRTTDWFLGAGPHARYDLQRRFDFLPGLAVFGAADGAVLVGQVRQHYYETLFTPVSAQANGTKRGTQTVPMLDAQTGLRYTPPSLPTLHFAAGYQYEEWFYLGKAQGTDSSGRLTLNGAFVNVRFDF